ncbi:MAG: rhodanese-related sulfurtransferase [Proteobacteria bacterium]|nr:rhodanese-related sulfurtransferase [Pseudomonadota bacterium]
MKVVSFYRFTRVSDPAKLQAALQSLCEKHGLLGTVLVAEEGVNGTLAGGEKELQLIFRWLEKELALTEPIDGRWTEVDEAPFQRMRIKVKNEIVTLGRPDIAPQAETGKHIEADDWNKLIADPGTLIIDTRNHYEIEVGSFPNAIDPGTDSFRQFPVFAEELAEEDKDRPLAMFCTGGIRCEKATALMLDLGFQEVYQLQGGILNYLENVTDEENQWQGECFVFDKRVAVDRDLAEGGYVQCHACRRPLSSEDLASADYREGVSCPKCIRTLEDDRATRLEERRKQVALARKRGEEHIGAKLDRANRN